MKSAGAEASQQHATTLPLDLWDPSAFAECTYKEALGKNQQEILKKREDEKVKNQRNNLDFVPAGTSKVTYQSGTSDHGNKGAKGSAAERVVEGLDRETNEVTQ